jgi:hypothetical protein
MQCPICGNTITFPAIPPTTGGKAIAIEQPRPVHKWAWGAKAIFIYLRDYPQWRIVAQISVPFLIIGALLAGAAFVKNKFSDEPAPVAAPVIQAQPGGWDKMTEIARSDQKVRQCVHSIAQAHASLLVLEGMHQAAEQEVARARGSQEREIAENHVHDADREVTQAQKVLGVLRERFEAELANYQKLGGTVDYRNQVQGY